MWTKDNADVVHARDTAKADAAIMKGFTIYTLWLGDDNNDKILDIVHNIMRIKNENKV